ncbi:MAG: hypothetical protein V4555_08225 [Acidobacteriota bacterium]
MKPALKPSEEFDRFTALVDQVMAVPRSEIEKRQADYQQERADKQGRKGPKPKAAKRPS